MTVAFSSWRRAIAAWSAAMAVGSALSGAPGVPSPMTAATPASILRGMSLQQRVGQLFMVGVPATGASATTMTTLRRYHVGNVMLTGRSRRGTVATRSVTDALQRQATATTTHGVRLFLATDQEGGYVQVLQGTGFSRMPTALVQGTWATTRLRRTAQLWGGQLRAAGINLDLGPVADTVPAANARANPPIGRYDREFGFTVPRVSSHATAFAAGLANVRVAAAVKHFPGLGRVTGNTDTTSGVTDRVTGRHDAYLVPFAASINAGTQFVMMSTAFYSRIDPGRPAAFSSRIIRTLLRGDLHFSRVVISDDLGAARQVAAWTPAHRAVLFLRAGGDMVLTVTPAVVPAMYNAVLRLAQTDAAFRSQVDASALRVLTSKQHQGLLPTSRR